MSDEKKNLGPCDSAHEPKKLTLSDEELDLLEEAELVDINGGRIGFPPCAAN